MWAGGQYHYSLVTCTCQNNNYYNTSCVEPHVEAPSMHYGCTQERHHLAQHAKHQTCVNRTGPETQTTKNVCAVNSAQVVSPLDFKYYL